MSTLSPHFRHLASIDAATAACRRELEATGGLEADRDTATRLTEAFLDQLMGLVEAMGGDPDYLESWPEKLADDIAVAFSGAIDARDERRTPESRAIYAAEIAVSHLCGRHQSTGG